MSKEEVKGKKVIEVGSRDVNGSLRPIIESWNPAEYVGVDIEEGPGVDLVCNVENIADKFSKESFDIVLSTELLEHVRNWRKVVSNIKAICKPNGIIFITTRSHGFSYHAFPYDFWRYELEDMNQIFSDCEILVLEKDPQLPGVFIKVKKRHPFVEKDLSGYKLYSIVADQRVSEITDKDFWNAHFLRITFKEKLKSLVFRVFRSGSKLLLY